MSESPFAGRPAPARPPLQFYFDFSSPYSYVASEWVNAVAARHGRTVQWHAILLGVTFQAAELKPPVAHPIKRDYALRDFERSAHFAGLPYRQPEHFPIATHNAARVFWWLHDTQGAQQAASFARAGLSCARRPMQLRMRTCRSRSSGRRARSSSTRAVITRRTCARLWSEVQ